MMFAINRHALVLAVVLLYTASFRLAVLDRPFDYDAEGASSSQYGILARSYLRFDWNRTLGMPVLTVGQLSTAPIVFYPDHPPLIPLLIAPFYAAFGVGEWQTRLPISIVTICAIYAMYRLLAHATTRRAGVTAAAVFAASPMILYFGGMPDPIGTPLILFVLFSVLGYLRFHRNPRLSTLMPFLGAFGLAGLCDWPAYVMAPIFLVHFVATRPRAEWPWILAFAAAACGLFAGLYTYITLATHSPWTWMLPLFARHTTLTDIPPFTLMQWFGNAIALNRMLHTLALMTACGLWVAMFGFRIRRSQPGATVARLLIVWGGLCILIGNKAAYGHEFVWMFLTPGLAVSTALLIESLFRVTERYRLASVMRISMAIAGAMFAGWTANDMFQRLYPTTRPVPFTPMEMGEAIRAAAPDPGDLALVIGGDGGPGAQMWFYGDRALRVNVWSISEVEDRLRQNWADLLFNFDVQPWDAAASGIVFPRIWDRDFAHVREYLEERYPTLTLSPALSEKFKVFSVTVRTRFRPVVGFGSPSASSSGRTSEDTLRDHTVTARTPSGTIASSKRMADGKEWTTANLNVTTPSSYCYDAAEPNCRRYGRLYTWESAQQGCQSLGDGWRLPTDDEWRQMAKHYGGVGNDSPDKGKAAYTALLSGGTSGFNAVLGGNRSIEGQYDRLEAHGVYWTVSENDPITAPFYNFAKGSQALYRQPQGQKQMAVSVRCVRE